MKSGSRLEAAQVFEIIYVFDWPGHNDAASEGSWFATLTWPDHVRFAATACTLLMIRL